ncbi:hypothetical protein HY837_03330 [archaeon]|nr:hypothetical protein [archaeon]
MVNPDEFVELAKKEVLKYQDLNAERTGVHNLSYSSGVGVNAGSYELILPDQKIGVFGKGDISSVQGSLRVSVEYRLLVEDSKYHDINSFDLTKLLSNAKPFGVLEYNIVQFLSSWAEPVEVVQAVFDLTNDVVEEVTLNKELEDHIPEIKKIKSLTVEDGITAFLTEVYLARKIEKR